MKVGTLTTTGIEFGTEKNINVFPDPSNGEITVSLDKYSGKAITLEVYDVTGKLCHSEKTTGSASVRVNIEQLESGYYFLRAQCAGEVFTAKFVRE